MPINLPWGASQFLRDQVNTNVLTAGGTKRPQPPQSIVAQSGPNSVLLTWRPVRENHPASRTRIYLDCEGNLYQEFPPGVTNTTVPADGGPSPKPRGIFLSYITPAGAESRKVQVICGAVPQENGAPPPSNPTPPAGSNPLNTGGGSGGGGARRPSTY
jgi:hypothetical protein